MTFWWLAGFSHVETKESTHWIYEESVSLHSFAAMKFLFAQVPMCLNRERGPTPLHRHQGIIELLRSTLLPPNDPESLH